MSALSRVVQRATNVSDNPFFYHKVHMSALNRIVH